MDWLGGGDTTIRNSFFRASDDVFALQGNWDGYELKLMRMPGHNVSNISIEDTIVSTSVSNTIRVGWPQKTFNSAHFHMRNVDVLHTGFGGCKVPFAFFELWTDPEGSGSHSDYTFQDIRLEEWYSLFQIRQPLPQVRDITFSNIWAMDGPGMVPSLVKGDVSEVTLLGASLQGVAGAEVQVKDGAVDPRIEPGVLNGAFTYTGGLLRPKQEISFTAQEAVAKGRQFEWIFGACQLARRGDVFGTGSLIRWALFTRWFWPLQGVTAHSGQGRGAGVEQPVCCCIAAAAFDVRRCGECCECGDRGWYQS